MFLSLFCFGIGLAGNTSDLVATELSMLNEDGVVQTILVNNNKMVCVPYPDATFSSLVPKQLSILSDHQKNKSLTMVNYQTRYYSLAHEEEYSYFDYAKNITFSVESVFEKYPDLYRRNYLGPFSGFLEADPENGDFSWPKSSSLNKDTISRLPETYKEIALTSFKANMYLEQGYKDADGTEMKIKSLDELIGKKLDGFTICGIFDTHEPIELINKYNDYSEKRFGRASLRDPYFQGSFLNNYAIVKSGSYEHFVSQHESDYHVSLDGAMIDLSPAVSENKSLLDKLTYQSDTNELSGMTFKGVRYHYSMQLESPCSDIIEGTRLFREGWINELIWVLGGVFGVLSAIVLSAMLIQNLRSKKTMSAFLISLGPSKRDLASIFITESFLWGLIPWVLSVIAILVACPCINRFFFCDFFVFGPIQSFILFGIAFAVVLLGVLVPVATLHKQKPH
jgi:hypothetical protein